MKKGVIKMATINKALNEANIQRIVENFNKDFDTKLKADNVKFLINLYNNFITLLETDTTIDNDIFERLDTLTKEIDKTYNEDEKLLFVKWTNTYERLISDVADQAFVYGYCTCKALDTEATLKESENNE